MNTKIDTKPLGKGRGKTPASQYKALILNPSWAEEVVKTRGLIGPLAKAIAADLADDATKGLIKYLTEERITKMIQKSFGKNVGKIKTEIPAE